MGLLLQNAVSEKKDASALELFDETGLYNYPTQQTSWNGVPTAFLADVTAASVTIYLTDTTTLLPSSTSVTIDVFPTLPNVIGDSYEVLATALGYSDGVIPDGMITAEYNVTVDMSGTPTVFTSSIDIILYANVCCCVEELIAATDPCECGCGNAATDTALNASMLLKSLGRAIDCNKENKAIEILKTLQQICAANNCQNCK